jgi:hypothetical protein
MKIKSYYFGYYKNPKNANKILNDSQPYFLLFL